jgi:S-adenosylmethionine uptake transporter
MASTAITNHPFPALPFAGALFGIASFSVMDAVMKGLAQNLGAYDAVFWRNLAGFAIMTPLYLATRNDWPSRAAMKLHLLRGSIGGTMAFTFFWGIARVPLAEGIALSFIAPLVALYLAALFLGEKVQPRIIIASAVSFVGVIIIAAGRAQGEFDDQAVWGIASILLSSVLYAGNIVLMRAQAQAAKPLEIVFWQSGIVAVGLALAALALPGVAVPWATIPDAIYWPPLLGSACLTVISLTILAWAYARAQMQQLVTTEYTAFIWASLFGWWWFDETLAITTIAGCAMIVAGCLVATRQHKMESA